MERTGSGAAIATKSCREYAGKMNSGRINVRRRIEYKMAGAMADDGKSGQVYRLLIYTAVAICVMIFEQSTVA